jgi:integrase
MLKAQQATLTKFLHELDDLHRSERTKQGYQFWLTKLAEHTSKPFEAMGPEDLAGFMRTLDSCSPVSRNTVRHVFNHFFATYLKHSEAMQHPTMKPEKAPDKVPDLLTDEEVDRLLAAARNVRDKALIAVFIEGGVRAGALATFPATAPAAKEGPPFMAFKDVQKTPYGWTVRIRHTKGSNQGLVPIATYAPDLTRWMSEHPGQQPDDPLWCYQREGKLLPLDYHAIHRLIHLAARRAGIDKRVHPHLFRKQSATTKKERLGMDSWDIAQLHGWVPDSRVMRKYIHQNPAAAIDRYVKGVGFNEKAQPAPERSLARKVCPQCKEILGPKSVYCWKCGMIQDKETAELYKESIKEGRKLGEQYQAKFEALEKQLAEQREGVKVRVEAMQKEVAGLEETLTKVRASQATTEKDLKAVLDWWNFLIDNRSFPWLPKDLHTPVPRIGSKASKKRGEQK